jgi:hypothetical protein
MERHDAGACFDTADDREAVRFGDRGQQFEVLTEPEVSERCAVGQRHRIEVDHAPNPGAPRDVSRVDADPV